MTTTADYTTRVRDEMYNIFLAYIGLAQRIELMTNEVTALGGATGIYGAAGVNFPEQPDGFSFADMAAAFTAITSLVGVPSSAQISAVLQARRD